MSLNSSSKVIHRFLRQPNIASSPHNRIANRYDPFSNTFTHLKDPQNNRELFLIGTTNSSTTLAHRTKKLIEEINPTSLYVQTTNDWWNHAKHTQVNNQNIFRQVSKCFPSEEYGHTNNLRGILWRIRYALWKSQIKFLLNFPSDFTPFTPGLQTKLAIQAAQRANAKVHFAGLEFDPITIEALRTETNMYAHTSIWKARLLFKSQNAWASDYYDFSTTLSTRGGQAFAESFDRSRANFLVALFSKLAPEQKRVLVDQRDENIFRDLYRNCEGNKIVAVVNQWHMQGIQTHWRRTTQTEEPTQEVSPVADMDIDSYQERHLVNEYLRNLASEVTKSEPATHHDYITNYHKENYEYERTRHTHHSSSDDIPKPGEKHHGSHH